MLRVLRIKFWIKSASEDCPQLVPAWLSAKSIIFLKHCIYHIVLCCCRPCHLPSSSNHFRNLSCRVKVLPPDQRAMTFLFVFRHGRICLLHDISGDSDLNDKAHQIMLILLTFSSLILVSVWYFYAKVLSLFTFYILSILM